MFQLIDAYHLTCTRVHQGIPGILLIQLDYIAAQVFLDTTPYNMSLIKLLPQSPFN